MSLIRDRLFVNAHQAGPDALRLAGSLGVGGVRGDGISDDLTTAPGVFTFGWLDEFLEHTKTLGLEVYMTFGYCPKYISPDRGTLPPLYDWEQFCQGLAEHCQGRLTFVGCWNEPQFPVDVYISRLLRPFAKAFKEVDAGYQICAPDLQTTGSGWPSWLRDFMQQGASLVDVLTIHAYAADADALWHKLTTPRPRWIPDWSPWPKPSIKEVIDRYGPRNRPLRCWLTECGFKSDVLGETGQAHEVGILVQKLLAADWPDGLCYYQLLDERPPTGDPVSFGLFRADDTIKPAGEVIQRYTDAPQVV